MSARTDHAGSFGENPEDRGFAFRAFGLGVIVTVVLARLVLPSEALPYWDADPSVLFSPSSALGPAHSLGLDVLTWLGAAIGLGGTLGRGPKFRSSARTWVWTLAIALAGLGVAGVCWHGLIDQGGDLDDLRVGSGWASAIVGGLVTLRLARDERLARVTLGLLIGAVGLLAIKGAAQLLVEHPTTLAMYRETRELFLQSQGWSQDSSAARAFERRLCQPEATGWFALSNVYASVAAAAAVALCGITAATWGTLTGMPRAALCFGSATALAAVAMSMSKGGAVATALGLLIVLALLKVRAVPSARSVLTPSVGGVIGMLAVFGALSAVVLRGKIGERFGELSLLFRWFYMQGAVRIFSQHQLVGVGPSGFKDGYLIAKPPISPEEVTSPHSVLFDWAATLGWAGLAWGVLWVGLVFAAGAQLTSWNALGRASDGRPAGEFGTARWGTRQEARVIVLIVMLLTVVGAWFDSPSATTDSAVVRVVGAVSWMGLSAAICAALRLAVARSMVAAGAIALAAHAQIEVTPIWTGTASWVLMLFAAVAAPGLGGSARRGAAAADGGSDVAPWAERRLGTVAIVMVLVAGCTGLAWFGLGPAWNWQRKVVGAAEAVKPLADFRQRFAALGGGRAGADDSPTALARDLSREVGRTIGDSEASIRRAIAELNSASLLRALEKLSEAAGDVSTHPGTLRAASKLAIQLASARHELGRDAEARELADRAEEFAFRATSGKHERSASWSWLGTLRSARATMLDERSAADRAIEAWLTASTFDPYGLSTAVRLTEAYQRRGDGESAATWARRALELDANTRLDPLKGLGADQRASLARLAGRS